MNITLTPDISVITPGKIFYLVVRKDQEKINYRQFITLATFNYSDILEEIRKEGIEKTEDVFKRFYDIAIDRELMESTDTYMLDLGEAGRPSVAMQDGYKQLLNGNNFVLKGFASAIDKMYLEFVGPEGYLYLMKVQSGDTLGQARIFLDDNESLLAQTTLDIIGPLDSDFPKDFEQDVEFSIRAALLEQFPAMTASITVKIRRSELAIAKEALYAPRR